MSSPASITVSARVQYDELGKRIKELQERRVALRPELMIQAFCEHVGVDLSRFECVSDFSVHWTWKEACSDAEYGEFLDGLLVISYTHTGPDGRVIRVQHDTTYNLQCTYWNREEPYEDLTHKLRVRGTDEFRYDKRGMSISVPASPDDTDRQGWASLMNAIMAELCNSNASSGWVEVMQLEV